MEVAHVPPAALRFRVHGDLSLTSFLETGKQCTQDIRDALARVGKDIDSFQHSLDFGCGCGRTLIWFPRYAPTAHFYGTDIDVTAIAWCRRHLKFALFETNDALPPLKYPAETFDFISAISVFTHLNEDFQLRWLAELRRVMRPYGYVLLTVHGLYYWDKLSPEIVDDIKRTGFVFTQGPGAMRDIFPEWYQTAYHTRDYVLAQYSSFFDVLEYIPNGLDHCQDIVILQKRLE